MPRTGTTALRAPRDSPTLTDLVKVAMRNTKLGIRTAVPARIVSYDAAKQTATVQPELLAVMNTEVGIQPQLPIELVEIPVAWPRTSAGYLTLPLAKDDTGLLIVSDRSIDKWTTKGVAADPGFNHTHNLIDGVFYPGLHAETDPITPATSATATVLEGATEVHLGQGATDFVALATKVEAQLKLIVDAIQVGVPVPTDGGAALQTAFTLFIDAAHPPPGSFPAAGLVAATKVKAV